MRLLSLGGQSPVRIGSPRVDPDPREGTVVHREAIKLLAALPPKCAGAVISDPPFFIGMRRNEGGAGFDPWTGKDVSDLEQMIAWSIPVAVQVARVLRPGGASVVMGGSQSIAAWEVAASKAGLVWMAEMTVLWNTGKPRPRNFGSLTTAVRWHCKPGARHAFNSGDLHAIYSNVLTCTKVPQQDRVHPAQKPVELTNFLVSLLTHEDDLVIDPFCGSGSTLVSAAICGRRWIGGDSDPDMCRIANRRAKQPELEEADLRPLYLWVNGKLTEVAA